MEPQPADRVDLPAYLARIGYDGPTRPGAAVLRELHRAHATHIPFENVDVLAGLPIGLDVPALEAKLVRARRGGYCFEQNMLLAAVLEQLGFAVKRLMVRVRYRSHRVLPLTHMALEVEADGTPWLADVGFGSHGLIEPVPLAEGESRQGVWQYRLARENDRWWVLQAPLDDGWRDLYTFTRDAYLPVDYEPPNYYVSHHPLSRFVQTLTAQLPLPEVRYLLIGRELTVERARETTTRTLTTDHELLAVMAETFGLSLPPGRWIPPLSDSPTGGVSNPGRREAGPGSEIPPTA